MIVMLLICMMSYDDEVVNMVHAQLSRLVVLVWTMYL